MDPGLLDVFHHPAQVQFLAVVQGVHVDFDGVVEEPVHQHGGAVADFRGPGDVAVQGGVVVDDLHAAPAQHETGAHQHRIADLRGDPFGLRRRGGHSVFRGGQPGVRQHPPERAPVLGEVDGLR